MTEEYVPTVVFQPDTYQGLQRGINTLADVVRPTLGPLSRIVAIAGFDSDKAPELLDDGGVIVRRILQLPDRDADVGAMFVRQVLWRVHEKYGDGTATTALLLQSVFNRGVHYLSSGGNAMVLRRYLVEGLAIVLAELNGMTVPVTGKEQLAQVAESICYDSALAKVMGEIFDIIGEYGHLEIRSARGRETEREYVEGMYWDGGLLSRELMITNEAELKAEMEDVAILISDLDVKEPGEMVSLLKMVHEAGIGSLLVIARTLADPVIGVITGVNKQNDDFCVVAAKSPGLKTPVRSGALEDMAVLTGGRSLLTAAGDSLRRIKLEDLGRARRAWANRNYVGINGGQGDPRMLREHIATLREAFDRAKTAEIRTELQKRIGRLMGGSATLRVGGVTETEIDVQKKLAERTANAMRATVREGVLPGGGAALLACRPALERRLEKSSLADERAAFRILIETMAVPMRAIIDNAGYDASEKMAEVKLAGEGHAFDVVKGQVIEAVEAGIWDPAAVLKAAVRSGVAGAALALTTDVLVHHKDPAERLSP